jgi:hypothetical protein
VERALVYGSSTGSLPADLATPQSGPGAQSTVRTSAWAPVLIAGHLACVLVWAAQAFARLGRPGLGSTG